MAPLPYSLPDAGDADAADALDWGPGVSNVPPALEGLPYGNFSKVNDKIGRIADFSTSSYGHKYQGEGYIMIGSCGGSPRRRALARVPRRSINLF